VKAERDQVVAEQLAPTIARLKQELGADPHRLSRAISSLYKRHALTPVRNLIALLFVPFLALFSVAFQRIAETTPTRLLWIDNLAQRDPYAVLPAMAAALFGVYLQASFVRKRSHGLLLWCLAVPALATSMTMLGAAVNMYILISALLLLIQRRLVPAPSAKEETSPKTLIQRLWPTSPAALISLDEPERLEGRGNKAYRLARLKAAGFEVPSGVLLPGDVLATWRAAPAKARNKLLDEICRVVGAETLAVRSSSAAEDGGARSFAGVFESVLNVDRTSLPYAIERVLQSFESERARSYSSTPGAANILVQRMVPAQYAGVMFSRDPSAATRVLVEMVDGTGEDLVSGQRTPTAYRFGCITGDAVVHDDQPQSPIDLRPLIELGRRSESLFGRPQDMEWAYANGRFFILQSRDIVKPLKPGKDDLIYAEWERVSCLVEGFKRDEVVLAQNEVSELMPRPTPLSLSLIQPVWASGGSIDLACRRIGLGYDVDEDTRPYIVTVFGHSYVDKTASRRISIGAVTGWKLNKIAEAVERAFKGEFLSAFLPEMRLAEAVDFDRMATVDLIQELERRRANFIGSTHVEIDVINVLSQFYLDQARKRLEALSANALPLLSPREQNEQQRLVNLALPFDGDERRDMLRRTVGHRAEFDYELSRPRYQESDIDLDLVLNRFAGAATTTHDTRATPKIPARVEREIERARRFQILKEDAKHHAMREVAVLRRMVLALARRFELGELIFFLTFEELGRLGAGARDELVALAALRHQQMLAFADLPPMPSELTPASIETASMGLVHKTTTSDQLAGTIVSGAAPVRGRARVISPESAEAGLPIDAFEPGDIIVSRMISPAWLVHFKDAGGLVSEIGGWLSHTAVVAREFGLMMVTGVKGAGEIPENAEIQIGKDGTIKILQDFDR
jgi:phosphohistidine swiveling domain-containing protein